MSFFKSHWVEGFSTVPQIQYLSINNNYNNIKVILNKYCDLLHTSCAWR